jgi:hypothetical protein
MALLTLKEALLITQKKNLQSLAQAMFGDRQIFHVSL